MNIEEKDNGRRQGKPECFYCGHPTAHTEDCTVPSRSVVIKMTVEYIVSVPRVWNTDSIEFQRNQGSWCASNDIEALAKYVDIGGHNCGCDATEFKFLREATEQDHAQMIDLTYATRST